MGKLKKEMKRIHSKRVKRTKEKVKTYLKGDVPLSQLNQLAKRMLTRKKKVDKKRQS